MLDRVGLGGLPIACGGVPLHTIRLASGGFSTTIAAGRRIAVTRDTFDAALVREAADQGGCFLDGTRAVVPERGELDVLRVELHRGDAKTRVRARAVLMAGGLSSLPSQFVSAIMPKSRIGLGAVLPPTAGVNLRGELVMACAASGYVGIAPVDGGRLDIAAAVDWRALSAAVSPARLIASMLREAGVPPIPGIEEARWRGTPMLSQRTWPLASHRCLVIGDAAGYIEPFTGEGIGWAMHGGELASAFIERRLESWRPNLADEWHVLYRAAFHRYHRRCRWITGLLRSRVVRLATIWSLQRAPFLADAVVRQLDRSLN
jgi:flavin-dependent dehydrogenase